MEENILVLVVEEPVVEALVDAAEVVPEEVTVVRDEELLVTVTEAEFEVDAALEVETEPVELLAVPPEMGN